MILNISEILPYTIRKYFITIDSTCLQPSVYFVKTDFLRNTKYSIKHTMPTIPLQMSNSGINIDKKNTHKIHPTQNIINSNTHNPPIISPSLTPLQHTKSGITTAQKSGIQIFQGARIQGAIWGTIMRNEFRGI